MSVAVHLLGRISIQHDGEWMPPSEMVGVLGRMILVRLSVSPYPISRITLIEDLWSDKTPPSTDSILNSTFSRLRKSLNALGLDSKHILLSSGGSAEIRWPSETRIDVRTATRAIDDAEAAFRKHDLQLALRCATVAYSITRNPLLPGIERIWLDNERERLRVVATRSLALLCDIWAARNDHESGLLMAQSLIAIDQYSQQAIQKLVKAHINRGDSPSAYLALTKYEELIGRDLGIKDTTALRDWYNEETAKDSSRFPLQPKIEKFGLVTHKRSDEYVFPPGWKWSVHIRTPETSDLCDMHHVGNVLAGAVTVAWRNGKTHTYKPGDSFDIAPDHDMWVEGDTEFRVDGW